jgi:hypothetical protein
MPVQLSILFNPESSLFTVPLKNSTMEKSEQMELEILISIRNNPNIPVDEFYKIFDCRWTTYRVFMGVLYNKELFSISRHELIPGLNRFELTCTGKGREAELLQERDREIAKILSGHNKAKKSRALRQTEVSLKSMPA